MGLVSNKYSDINTNPLSVRMTNPPAIPLLFPCLMDLKACGMPEVIKHAMAIYPIMEIIYFFILA